MKLTRDLAFRVWIPFVLVSIVASTVFAWFFSRNQSAIYHKQQLRELQVVANSLSTSVAVLVRKGDTLAIGDLLRAASGRVGFTAVISGETIPGVQEIITSNNPLADLNEMADSTRWFTYRQEVILDRSATWRVTVGLSQTLIDEQLFRINFPVYLALVVSVVLACILFYLMSLQFSEPVVETTRFTEKLLKGDFSGHLEGTHGIYEIGRLNDALNNLKVTLARQRTRNKELTAGLEFQVSKRTMELKLALQRLNAAQEIALLSNFIYWPGSDVWEMSANINSILGEDADRISTLEGLLSFIAPEDRTAAAVELQKAFSANERVSIDFRVDPSRRRGNCWASLIAEFKNDPSSGLPFLSGTVQDITARKEIEARIDQLALVARLTTNGVVITDPSRVIIWVNEGMEKLTGYTAGEMIGNSPKMFQSPQTSLAVRKEIRTKLDRLERVRVVLENISKQGQPYFIELHIEPFRDSYGNLAGFLAIQVDITERILHENELKKALSKETELNQMKSRFISMTSHEFRTPLTSIQSSAELLQMMYSEGDDEQSRKSMRFLSRILSEVRRLTSLMDDILVLGRVEAGRITLAPVETDLVVLVEEIFGERRLLYNDDRSIRVVYEGQPRKLRIDPLLFSHILNNIGTNALKYSKGRPEPVLTVGWKEDHLRLAMCDEGIGIPEDDLKNLFQSFHRGANVANIQGTGLGLVIVKQFTDLHRGRIQLKSSENRGTCVILEFPYRELDNLA